MLGNKELVFELHTKYVGILTFWRRIFFLILAQLYIKY